jgi:hypothetical protein
MRASEHEHICKITIEKTLSVPYNFGNQHIKYVIFETVSKYVAGDSQLNVFEYSDLLK